MSTAALGLVLASALMHAGWNFLAKGASGGAAFVWLFTCSSALLYAPLAITVAFVERPHIGSVEVGFMAGTALLHVGYFLSLQKGYEVGDLSLVYPLARGVGPLIATGMAMALLGERPSALALGGAFVIGVGALILARGGSGRALQGTAFGLLTALLIACYTLWDKYAVGSLDIPPIVYDWGNNLGRGLLLLPIAMSRKREVAETWRAHRKRVIGVAALSPLAYILVLTALSFTAVSYVAPAREISIVIGAALGTQVLAEGHAVRRLVAATAIVGGVIALALG